MKRKWMPMAQKLTSLVLAGVLGVGSAMFGETTSAATLSEIQDLRDQFNWYCDLLDEQLVRIQHSHGRLLVQSARRSMASITDEQFLELYASRELPDLGPALADVEDLLSETRTRNSSEEEPPAAASLVTPHPLPDAPPIIGACDDIAHDATSRLVFLSVWQGARTVLAAAEMGCLQTVVAAGFGGNGALVCEGFAIALAAAEIPVDLGEFCADEETAAKVEGNYARLGHLHDDLEAAKIEIIGEVQALGCEIVRLLNTPHGQRSSQIQSCSAQPLFPYAWPEEWQWRNQTGVLGPDVSANQSQPTDVSSPASDQGASEPAGPAMGEHR